TRRARRGISCRRTTSATPACKFSRPPASRSPPCSRNDVAASVSEWRGANHPASNPLAHARGYIADKKNRRVPFGGTRRSREKVRDVLGNVAGDELGHLEHRDLALAAEHRLELVIGVDLRADLLVLETVLLDVSPELFGELRAGE